MNFWASILMTLLISQSVGASIVLWGVEIDGLEIGSGLALLSNSVVDSAPDPVVNTLSLSVPFRFQEIFVFRPEAQVHFQNYGFENGRAVPLESMFDSVMMMALVLSPRVGVEFSLGDNLGVMGDWSLDFVNRIPVFFIGQGGSQALDITGWFISGRFLYTSVSGGMLWKFSEFFTLALRGKYSLPLFNFWTGETWWDQQIWELGLGIRWVF